MYPKINNRLLGKIGSPPKYLLAEQTRQSQEYLRLYSGRQIFSYAGPPNDRRGWHSSPDYDYQETYDEYPEFAIITRGPARVGGAATRNLAAVVLPWRVVPKYHAFGHIQTAPTIWWKDGESGIYSIIYRGYGAWPSDWEDTSTGLYQLNMDNHIKLYDTKSHNLIQDASMEIGGGAISAHWVPSAGAQLSKETSVHRTGSQSLKILNIGGTNPYARNVYNITTGATYSLTAWMCGDGATAPIITCGGDTLWTGTTSATWQYIDVSFEADADILKFGMVSTDADDAVYLDDVWLSEVGRFRYTPAGNNDFGVGFLRYDRMRIAALSIFEAPTVTIPDEDRPVLQSNVAQGRAIRGTDVDAQASIGTVADMTYSATELDNAVNNSGRVLLASGHPRGLRTSTSDWYNIRGGNVSYFRTYPSNVFRRTTTVWATPCAYGYCSLAGAENLGYIRYSSVTAGDSVTHEIAADAAGLWTGDPLEVAATGDLISVEVKAPTGGWLVLKSFSIWEDPLS